MPSEFPFAFRDVVVRSDARTFGGLVITPRNPMVTGRERIARLRTATSLSDVELRLIDTISNRARPVDVVFIRAVNDAGERVWSFDPSLSEDELLDGGEVVCRSLLPFQRAILGRGVIQLVHVDWGTAECVGMRRGCQQLVEELESKECALTATERADLWILKHMLLHAALGLEHVLEKLLPRHMQLLERRRPQLARLVADLPG